MASVTFLLPSTDDADADAGLSAPYEVSAQRMQRHPLFRCRTSL
jgi:hypothetical protein